VARLVAGARTKRVRTAAATGGHPEGAEAKPAGDLAAIRDFTEYRESHALP